MALGLSLGTCTRGETRPPRTGKDSTLVVSFEGRLRHAVVHVPGSYNGADAVPAVLNFHGWGSNPNEQMALTGMNALADREGFLVVYPEGTGRMLGFNAGDCCGDPIAQKVDDVGFTRALLDELQRTYRVDSKRVYATGMSNGGFLAHRLACELSDRVAAIAAVSGVMGIRDCSPKRPVSVLQFHGTADNLVGFRGGGLAVFTPVETTVRDWARRDGCAGLGQDWASDRRTITFRKGDATCERYEGCREGTEVELCRIDGGGHTWPGGPSLPQFGSTSADISASEAMWRFFSGHRLSDRPQ